MKYFHHYLALEPEILEQTGSFQIAHYTGGLLQMLKGSSCGKIEKDVKKMSDIVKDVKKGLYIIKNPAYPTSPEEYKEAHNRLERRLGETDYKIASNNCEHFASYVMIGTATCEQNNQAGHSKKVVSDTVDMFVCDGKSNATKTFGYLLSLAPMDQFLREAADEVITVAATGVFKAGQKTVKQIIKHMFRYAKSTRESVINKIYASEKYCAVANGATLRATLKAAGVTALFTLVIECVFAGYAIYKLKQRKKKKPNIEARIQQGILEDHNSCTSSYNIYNCWNGFGSTVFPDSSTWGFFGWITWKYVWTMGSIGINWVFI